MVKNHASSLNQNIDITRQCHLTCFVSMCVPVPSWPSSNKYLGVNSLLLWWLLLFFLFSKYFAKKGRVSSSNQKEDKINWQWRYQQTHYCHSIELNWLSDTVFWHQTPSRICLDTIQVTQMEDHTSVCFGGVWMWAVPCQRASGTNHSLWPI